MIITFLYALRVTLTAGVLIPALVRAQRRIYFPQSEILELAGWPATHPHLVTHQSVEEEIGFYVTLTSFLVPH